MVANAAFDARPTHHQMDEVCFVAALEANLSFEGAIFLELDTSIALGFVMSEQVKLDFVSAEGRGAAGASRL